MFRLKRTKIGLEVSDREVQAVEMVPSRRKNRLVNFAIAKIDFTKGEDGVVEAVRTVLSDMKVRPDSRINLSVGSNNVDMQWVNRSRLTEKESKEKTIQRKHNDLEDIVHDEYVVRGEKSLIKTSTVLRVEANKSVVDKYKYLIESAGFTCGNIDVEPFTLFNGFLMNGPPVDHSRSIALMNVGEEKTTIIIFKNKVLHYTRTFSLDCKKLLSQIPEWFDLDFEFNCAEIESVLPDSGKEVFEMVMSNNNKLIDYLLKSFKIYELEQSTSVQEVYVSGKVAAFKNFDNYLRRILGMKVLKWNPAYMVLSSKKKENARLFRKSAMSLTIPIGLASHPEYSLNLRPKDEINKNKAVLIKPKSFLKGLMVVVLAAAAISIAGFFILNMKMPFTKIDLDSFIGINKKEVISKMGEPFLRDYNFSSKVYDEEWIFYLKQNDASSLVLQFKGGNVVRSFIK